MFATLTDIFPGGEHESVEKGVEGRESLSAYRSIVRL